MYRTICVAALFAQGSAHGARFDDIPALQQKLKMFIENPGPDANHEKHALQVGEQPAIKQQEPADVSYKYSSSKRVLAEDDAEAGDAETADKSPSPEEADRAAAEAAEKAAAEAAEKAAADKKAAAEKAAADKKALAERNAAAKKAAAERKAAAEAAEKAAAEAAEKAAAEAAEKAAAEAAEKAAAEAAEKAEAEAAERAAAEAKQAAEAADRAAAEAEAEYREEQNGNDMNPYDFFKKAMNMVRGYDGPIEMCPHEDYSCNEVVPSGQGCCSEIQISDYRTGNQDQLFMCVDTMFIDGAEEFEVMDRRVVMYCTEDYKKGSTYLTSAIMVSLAALVSMTVF